jgi:hypothetical protein
MDEFGKAFAAWGDSIEAGTMAVCERAGTPMHESSAAAYGAVWGLYVRTGEPAEKRLPLFKRFNELFPPSDAASNDAVMRAIDQWDAEQTRIHQQGLAEDDPYRAYGDLYEWVNDVEGDKPDAYDVYFRLSLDQHANAKEIEEIADAIFDARQPSVLMARVMAASVLVEIAMALAHWAKSRPVTALDGGRRGDGFNS